ncbi:hypothetical protein VNO80_17133 [Phaseolus coccineus]|uniref:Uncharacterized protein n=1 Tax=Phaseolus coccineus TaxID=3886 RepID=A0AAN9MPV3_PHACN
MGTEREFTKTRSERAKTTNQGEMVSLMIKLQWKTKPGYTIFTWLLPRRRSRLEDHVNVKDQLSPKTLARAQEHDASTLPHFFRRCFCVHINLSAEKVKGFCFLCFFKTKHKIHSWLHLQPNPPLLFTPIAIA